MLGERMDYDFDLIVIGSGSGGSVGAHHAAARGKKVAIVEREHIGGECPNTACVPTKALLHAAHVYQTVLNADEYGVKIHDADLDYRSVWKWKKRVVSRTGAAKGSALFEDEGIQVLRGSAHFVSSHTIEIARKKYTAKNFLIATGTEVFIPPIPGLQDAGYITFADAVNFDTLPESLFIIGGGPIGCEFAQAFATFGAKVYLADAAPRLLIRDDADAGNLIQTLFENKGIKVFVATTVTKVSKRGGKKVVTYTHKGEEHTVSVEEVFVAAGKKPAIDLLDLERAGVSFNKHGIKVNRLMQTTASHIYAAGDVVGPYMYTPTASYQSAIAAHNMFSRQKRKADYAIVPRAVFLTPEVASVGLSEEEALEKKIKIRKGISLIGTLGRANTSNEMDGFVKVLTSPDGRIVGAVIVAPRAGEMIHELALAIKLRAKAHDIASMIHAYPTFSEAIKLACASVE
jgi:mercuric reductase